MIQSFSLVFPLSNSSINTKQAVSQATRNPSSKHNPYSCKNFLKLVKFEFQITASIKVFHPSNLALEVPRSPKHLLLEANSSQIKPFNSHRFAILYNFDFDIPCIANHSHVFI